MNLNKSVVASNPIVQQVRVGIEPEDKTADAARVIVGGTATGATLQDEINKVFVEYPLGKRQDALKNPEPKKLICPKYKEAMIVKYGINFEEYRAYYQCDREACAFWKPYYSGAEGFTGGHCGLVK